MKENIHVYKHHKETIQVYLPQNKSSITETMIKGIQGGPNALNLGNQKCISNQVESSIHA